MLAGHDKERLEMRSAHGAYEHLYKAAARLHSKLKLCGPHAECMMREWGVSEDFFARLRTPRSPRRRPPGPPRARPRAWDPIEHYSVFPRFIERLLRAAREAGGGLQFLRSDRDDKQTLKRALRLLARFLPPGFLSDPRMTDSR